VGVDEGVSLLRVLFAFAAVIGLMFLLMWILKKIGIERLGQGKKSGSLMLEEQLYIDARRKVVILKRGQKRYVVLVGTESELLLETYDGDENEV